MAAGVAPTRLVREELVRVRAGRACDRRAELAALLRGAGTFQVRSGGRYGLEATAEHPAVARRLYEALREALGARGEVLLMEPGRGHPHLRYVVRADGLSLQRLVESGVLDERGRPGARIPRRLTAKRCCAAAYLRGAFLARGSVADPRRAAHLEIRASDPASAESIAAMMEHVGAVRARTRSHRGSEVAYLKDTTSIGTVLAAMGAHEAYLAWEESAVWKGVHVEAARLANADAANARRLAGASAAQLRAIDAIEERDGLDSLAPSLREVAERRRAHPDASIEELGRLCRPPATKATTAGRLRRLREIADAGAPRGGRAAVKRRKDSR